MSHEDLERINSLLDGSTRIDLSDLLSDGRIGLAVVRELARRHNIRVRLQSNIFGGIAAAVVIPPQLLSEQQQETRQQQEKLEQSEPPPLPKRRPDPAQEPPRPAPAGEPAGRTPEPARVPAPVPIPAATESAGRLTPAARLAPPPGPGATVPESPGHASPVQVPSPMPIPSTAAPSRPSRHRAEAEDDLPVLPVRAPGRSYDDLRAGGNGIVIEETAAQQGDVPPPLPQRRGSHLRAELLEPPSVTKPVPGHNTSLMKTFQAGRDSWYAQQDHDQDKSRGDTWPTT